MTIIRTERPDDETQIYEINRQAFGRPLEGEVINRLRQSCPEGISLVAENDGSLVGHILFTPAYIETADQQIYGMGLGPMAVLPEHQSRGIGSALVRAGLERLRQARQPFVVVVGHPWFYPKFGFEPADRYGIGCEYPGVPAEAFMVLILDPERMEGVQGMAHERPEFAEAM